MTKVQFNSCLEWKESHEFNWRYKALGIRHPTCRECQKPFRKNWYEDNKEEHLQNVKARKEKVRLLAKIYVWDYLMNQPCIECGEADPTVLEFHYRYEKRSEISRMIADGLSIATIQSEIDKCDILCANCHRKRTSKEQGWFRK